MLNTRNLSNQTFFFALLFFLLLVLFTSLNCGKRKPPQPPKEKISQRMEIFGSQRGNIVTISWKLPTQNADDKSVLNINRADIYRLAEPLNNSLTLSEEEFASRSILISSILISKADFLRNQVNFNDTLEFAGQNIRLRYAVRFVNAAGQKASFSNFLLIEPTAKVSLNPVLTGVKVAEEAIEILWQAPKENVDGSQPVNLLGYNIYRISSNFDSYLKINNEPVTQTFFIDRKFEFEKNYKYFVRAVSLGINSEFIESLDSNTISVMTKDTFAPSAPSGITIAAAPKNLSLFFALNPEKDVVGYRIYRTVDSSQPLSKWVLLTKTLLNSNTFQDVSVESGATYYYYVVAVDRIGNISPASVIVMETAP